MENTEVSSVRVPTVKNKDIPVLSNYLYYVKAVEKLEEQIAWEHDRKINISQHITGMPNGKGGVNGLDNTFARIDQLEQEHREQVDRYRRCVRAADNILNGIESVSMRVFVRLKYMSNMSDADIRRELNISRRGLERARQCIESAHSMQSVRWPERFIMIQDE